MVQVTARRLERGPWGTQRKEKKKNKLEILEFLVTKGESGFNRIWMGTKIGSKSTVNNHLKELIRENYIEKKGEKYAVTDMGREKYECLKIEVRRLGHPVREVKSFSGRTIAESAESIQKGSLTVVDLSGTVYLPETVDPPKEDLSFRYDRDAEKMCIEVPKQYVVTAGSAVVHWIPRRDKNYI